MLSLQLLKSILGVRIHLFLCDAYVRNIAEKLDGHRYIIHFLMIGVGSLHLPITLHFYFGLLALGERAENDTAILY